MADDEWEDTLVTSWTYADKRMVFYASEIKQFSFVSDTENPNRRYLVGVLRPTHPTGSLTFLCSKDANPDVPTIDSVFKVDHQNIKIVGGVCDLKQHQHGVIDRGSTIFTGSFSSGDNNYVLVDSGGLLTFGQHKVKIRIRKSSFEWRPKPQWLDYFKWDQMGVVYIEGVDEQIRELRGTAIISYPKTLSALGFAASETHIFVVSGSGSGCELIRFDRSNLTCSETRSLISLDSSQFECMQVHKRYLLISFLGKDGVKTLVDYYKDHHLYMYDTSDLSFMQKLTFSSCGYLPKKLHTKNTWDLVRQHEHSTDTQHVPYWHEPSGSFSSLNDKEAYQLRCRKISPLDSSLLNAMIIFPYKGDEKQLVVALRNRANTLYLFSINKGWLAQCDALLLFDKGSTDSYHQFSIFPRPDLQGIIAITNQCMLGNISLTIYIVNS